MPITIRSIVVHDGTLTDAGEDLCARVYEAITGKCWHKIKWPDQKLKYIGLDAEIIVSVCECGYKPERFIITLGTINPSLLTDLNAVHELEVLLTRDQFNEYAFNLISNCGVSVCYAPTSEIPLAEMDAVYFVATAKAHYKVAALASVVQVKCGECGGDGIGYCYVHGTNSCPADNMGCARTQDCDSCSGTGRITILDRWEREWRSK